MLGLSVWCRHLYIVELSDLPVLTTIVRGNHAMRMLARNWSVLVHIDRLR